MAEIPEESTDELDCPGCGLYTMYTLKAQEKPDMQRLHWCMSRSLVLVFFQIGFYKNGPLDEAALVHMDQVLTELDQEKKEVILRIAYDNTGNGLSHEPGNFEQILKHIRQMAPVIQRHRDCILIFQGMLLGSWGEMHSSRYLGTARLKTLSYEIREILGRDTYMAFRRPTQYRQLYPKVMGEQRTGLFDDGMFGSEDDLGTFGVQSAIESGWTGAWEKKEELAFIGELAKHAPVGGEVVWGKDREYQRSLEQILEHLQKLHVSYLNSEYDTRVYDAWEKLTFHKKGAWKNMNGKEYILRHIGYRLRMESLTVKAQQEHFVLEAVIKNDGFATFYRKLSANLILGEHKFPLKEECLEIAPQKKVLFRGEIPQEKGPVFLELLNDRQAMVPLANKGQKDGRLLIGEII